MQKEISAGEITRQKEMIHALREEFAKRKQPVYAFVETYGCQQNESDSERLKGMLADMGCVFVSSPKEADIVLYNTCAVRENAELKVFGNIGALKHQKRRRPDMLIGVCGCMMQQAHIAETIRKKYPHVDLVFGTHALYRFPALLAEAMQKGRVFDTADEDGAVFEGIPCKRDMPPLAKLPIMYGCNNFCSYCIVPYVRGRERSRTVSNILSEAAQIASEGYKEIMLLGQNVNSYDSDGIHFPELLQKVCAVDGIERVRFMTSHPKDLSDELIAVMAAEKKVCNQLHLPVQSGSDAVLQAMNRHYTRAHYLRLVEKVRDKIPDIVLTTDIIAGFPTETQADFEDTLSLLQEVEYDSIFSFIYSRRIGTPAAALPSVLSDEQIHRNFERMLTVQNAISKRRNDAYLGSVQRVLAEGPSKNDPSAMTGRTEGGKVVNFPGTADLTGRMLDIKITKVQTWSLYGELMKEQNEQKG